MENVGSRITKRTVHSKIESIKMLKSILAVFAFLYVTINAERIIIDTDAGADDGLAILMLLRAQQAQPDGIQIVAITCSYGNTAEENVERNVLKILTIANRSDIPVYRGSKKPLIGAHKTDNFFGLDGFGDAPFHRNIIGEVDESMHASVALTVLAKKLEGDVSIVALGPTTNIALAASLDDTFISRVNKFYVLGSSVTGMGNFKPNVEFNFAADPESNFILLNAANSSQLTLLPWDICYSARIPKDWRMNVLGKKNSPYVKFINAIESIVLRETGESYVSADAIFAATIAWPHIVKQSLVTYVHAVYDGAARGSVLVEYPFDLIPQPKRTNAKIIQSIDTELFKKAMIYHFSCEHIAC